MVANKTQEGTITKLLGLLHDVVSKPVRHLRRPFRCRFEVARAGRRRWSEEGKHGGPVALHAHFPSLIHKTAREVVRAPFVVAGVANALDLKRLGECVAWGSGGRQGAQGSEKYSRLAGLDFSLLFLRVPLTLVHVINDLFTIAPPVLFFFCYFAIFF